MALLHAQARQNLFKRAVFIFKNNSHRQMKFIFGQPELAFRFPFFRISRIKYGGKIADRGFDGGLALFLINIFFAALALAHPYR